MTRASKELIHELCGLLEQNKYLLLSGGSGVGKTYLALEVAKECRMGGACVEEGQYTLGEPYEVETQLVPIHPSYHYEDFVAGIALETQDGLFRFRYQDKIFLTLLRRANQSWERGERKKYVLILDDIGRGMISGILGDVLPLIEPHGGQVFCLAARDGTQLRIPPNFYILATQSTLTDRMEPAHYGMLRRFYHRGIEADYRYMSDAASNAYSDYDMSANAMFYRCRRLVLEHLRYAGQLPAQEREKYVIGHGVFREDAIALAMRCQVLPILRQYGKEGVLDRSAIPELQSLEKMVTGRCTKDPGRWDCHWITGQRKDVTAQVFYTEDRTHRPIYNLVSRIKTQGLMSDADLWERILFHPGILVRKSGTLNGTVRSFPHPAYLFVKQEERDLYSYGTTRTKDGKPKRPRYFYSSSAEDMLVIDKVRYVCASEMQPKEYTRWSDELNSDTYINERGSSSPNSILFRILRSYYGCLIQRCVEYLDEFPEDENIRLLQAFAEDELKQLIQQIKRIGSGSDEASVNQERNRQFREAVSRLRLLWTDRGERIDWNGQSIQVEGVYKVNIKEHCQEYAYAMESLGIHQMILQGPPGTSKTYSAREFLKYMGDGAGGFLSDEELERLQIRDYEDPARLSAWEESYPPPIAWDIVQFHPSYGYEDFVRGIEVSTRTAPDGAGSSISYDTVNKVLGKMAAAAGRPGFERTKFFLVIDEINRANLATVFGELIYALEYRDQGVATPYTVGGSNKVCLPDNLYIVGTMNTADKSIGGIDYAIRRRFLFFPQLPDRETILKYRLSEGEDEGQRAVNEQAARLFDAVERLFGPDYLNGEYFKDDVQLGHTYFLVDSEEQLFLRFQYQILPILKEYFKDGMFRLEEQEEEDGLRSLMDCISGRTGPNADSEQIWDIFDRLCAGTPAGA